MKVPIFRHQATGCQLLAVFRKTWDCQYTSVRKNCLCNIQNYSHRKVLSVNTGLASVQKRYKMREQPSDIGLYFGKRGKAPSKQTKIEEISDGLEIIKKGIPQFKDELIERLTVDQDFFPEHGDFEYLQRFQGEKSLKNWLLTTDQDTGQGKSTATFTATDRGTALFQGYLNTDVPKDGFTKRAGYCNIRSPYKKISFERQIPHDWTRYTHMYLKVRGDGRNYMVIIQMDRFFDQNMFDLYNFPLYTKGGPYWQIVKIPFADFFLAAMGRAQDKQQKINLAKVKYMGITVGDGVKGPFQLEIDYIALVRDMLTKTDRDFKYELYQKKYWET